MQVQRIQNTNYNTKFGIKTKTEEIKTARKILDIIQNNMELSDASTRSDMQTILHNMSIKEGIPDALKQQAKNLLLESYM